MGVRYTVFSDSFNRVDFVGKTGRLSPIQSGFFAFFKALSVAWRGPTPGQLLNIYVDICSFF